MERNGEGEKNKMLNKERIQHAQNYVAIYVRGGMTEQQLLRFIRPLRNSYREGEA